VTDEDDLLAIHQLLPAPTLACLPAACARLPVALQGAAPTPMAALIALVPAEFCWLSAS